MSTTSLFGANYANAGSAYVGNSYIAILVGSDYIECAYIRDAWDWGIYLQSFWILEMRLYSNGW